VPPPPSHPLGLVARLSERLRAAYRHDRGEVAPPADLAKRRHLLSIFRARAHTVLIESGTYLGGTVEFFIPHADRIVSVEIEPDLYEAARRRFADEPKVELHLGDAAKLIPELAAALKRPALVWLDGHFTGGINTEPGDEVEPAPGILETLGGLELPAGMTIVVDDLRLFGRGNGFPPLDTLTASARGAFPQAEIFTGLDSLVILNR
jgi:hypothetical protein